MTRSHLATEHLLYRPKSAGTHPIHANVEAAEPDKGSVNHISHGSFIANIHLNVLANKGAISAPTYLARSTSMSPTTTRAPSVANMAAMRRIMPNPPPETTATLPSNIPATIASPVYGSHAHL